MGIVTDRDLMLAEPLALKREGSPEWCWQVAMALKVAHAQFDREYARVLDLVSRLAEHAAWEKIPPGDEQPYGDEDTMLRALTGEDKPTIVYRAMTAQERMKDAPTLLTHREAGALGGRGKRKDPAVSRVFTYGSEDADYWARRIKRDRPDIAARLDAGEFPSMRQARIAAGLYHAPTRLDNLRSHWRNATAEERAAFLAEVAPPQEE